MSIVSHSPSDGFKTPNDIFRSVADVTAAVWNAMRHRRSVGKLADMDKHALDDLGLTESDVRSALDQPLMSDPSRYLTTMVTNRHEAAWLARNARR